MIPVTNENEIGLWYINIRVSKKVPDIEKYAKRIDAFCKKKREWSDIGSSNRRWDLAYRLPYSKVKSMINKLNKFNDAEKVKYIREIQVGRCC